MPKLHDAMADRSGADKPWTCRSAFLPLVIYILVSSDLRRQAEIFSILYMTRISYH